MGLLGVLAVLVVIYLCALLSGIYSIKEGEIGLLKEFGVLKKDLI
jgi:regulator of protease activity HflC (stomatin/prohibitin superfamily)